MRRAPQVLYARTDLDMDNPAFPAYIAALQEWAAEGRFARYDDFIDDIDGVRRGAYCTWLTNGWLVLITLPV